MKTVVLLSEMCNSTLAMEKTIPGTVNFSTQTSLKNRSNTVINSSSDRIYFRVYDTSALKYKYVCLKASNLSEPYIFETGGQVNTSDIVGSMPPLGSTRGTEFVYVSGSYRQDMLVHNPSGNTLRYLNFDDANNNDWQIRTDLTTDHSGDVIYGTYSQIRGSNYAGGKSKFLMNAVGDKKEIIIDNQSRVCFISGSAFYIVGNGVPVPLSPAPPPPPAMSMFYTAVTIQGIKFVYNWGLGRTYVYKAGSPYKRLNDVPLEPGESFIDMDVEPGQSYSYIFTVIDEYDQESEPSEVLTIVFGTPTVTSTITETATITPTHTVTPTVTPTSTPAMALVLKYRSSDNNEPSNSPHQQMELHNMDTRVLELHRVEIRYWYTYEGSGQGETAEKDDIRILPPGTDIKQNTTAQITTGAYPAGQNRYLKINFSPAAGSLLSGQYLQIFTRFNNTDWSSYTQSNDWSYNSTTAYTEWDKVTVYVDGVLAWGTEPFDMPTMTVTETPVIYESDTPTPQDTFTQTPSVTETPSETVSATSTETLTATTTYTETATDTVTDTITPTITATITPTITPTITITITPTATATITQTVTMSVTETVTATVTPTITETVTSSLTAVTETPVMTLTPTPVLPNLLLKYMSADNNTGTNSPKPNIRLYNTSGTPLDLSSVEIRYWYSYEGQGETETAVVDYAGKLPAGTNITSAVQKAIESGAYGGGQDRYLKITFAQSAGSLGQGEYAEIQARFNKSNWSSYNQSNDHSFYPFTQYTDWDKICVYINGIKVLGEQPGVGMLAVKSGRERNVVFDSKSVYAYPNPAKNETVIRFGCEEPAETRITIYSTGGTLIREITLGENEVTAGINRVTWDICDGRGVKIKNGIYIMKIENNNRVVTKKIAVVK